MAVAHRFERSRTYPVEPSLAFDRTMALPLPSLFRLRYGPIPPIKEVRDQTGEWRSVGQTRTIALQGGGSMKETLTEVEVPRVFRYELSDLTGPMKPLVGGVEGAWRFDPVGTGVRVTWTWDVYPASSVAARAMPILRRFWSGYARRALEVLEGQLVR